MLVLLDSTPLRMVTYAVVRSEIGECNEWLEQLLINDVPVLVPEIIDYELRRELIRTDNFDAIEFLNKLAADLGYLKLNSETYQIAASLWASVRKKGQPTAADERLDIDCLLAAQAHQVSTIPPFHDSQIRIATWDSDLSRFDRGRVRALQWRDIKPTP
jgi:predicted nucleic acid-binding protein